jgi:hypothetical protein
MSSENIFYNVNELYAFRRSQSFDLEELKEELNYNKIGNDLKGMEPGMFYYGNEEQYNDDAFIEEQELINSLKHQYSSEYTVKMLGQIMDFYELPKKNLKKCEMVETLLMFETDQKNRETVKKRLRFWSNIVELKNDKFFSKYITFDI